jgi:hypothetical protein
MFLKPGKTESLSFGVVRIYFMARLQRDTPLSWRPPGELNPATLGLEALVGTLGSLSIPYLNRGDRNVNS